MDEFKSKSILKNAYDDMWNNIPKKFGRKAARRSLKNSIEDIYSEYMWWRNEQLFNTWDEDEWDDHGRYCMLCNEIDEYGDWGKYISSVDDHCNMMDWTNDAIRF